MRDDTAVAADPNRCFTLFQAAAVAARAAMTAGRWEPRHQDMSIAAIIALICIALGAMGLAWAVVQVFEARSSVHWPTTVATVTQSWVSRKKGSEGDMFEANVTYRYFVDGKEIVANRIRIGGRTSQSWRGPSERLVAKYPVGRGVTIAYHPDDPTQGVLEPGSTKSAWFLAAFCAGWIAIFVFVLRDAL